MKKLFVLLVLCICSLCMLYAQPVGKIGSYLWSICKCSSYDSQCYGSYYMKFSGEETIGEYTYRKVIYSNDENQENWIPAGYMRAEGDKVYYRHSANYEDILYYDFSLQLGDEFYVEAIECTLVVDSVGTMTVGDEQKKLMRLTDGGMSVIWCEGIGSMDGLLNYFGSIRMVGGYEKLLCVQENDESLFVNPQFGECFIRGTADLHSNELSSVSIYPNPSSGKFYISAEGMDARADIYDLLGRKIVDIENIDNEIEIDLSGYGKGIYFVQLKIDGEVTTKKIVVE